MSAMQYQKDIARVLLACREHPQHTFLLLTKIPLRLRQFNEILATAPNIWCGISAEDQETLEERAAHLFQVDAEVRWISLEPLLGPVTLKPLGRLPFIQPSAHPNRQLIGPLHRRFQWLPVGGESGPKARPCDVNWIWRVIYEAGVAGVPCYHKQIGSNPIETKDDGETIGPVKVDSYKGNSPEEWPEKYRVREFPNGVE